MLYFKLEIFPLDNKRTGTVCKENWNGGRMGELGTNIIISTSSFNRMDFETKRVTFKLS